MQYLRRNLTTAEQGMMLEEFTFHPLLGRMRSNGYLELLGARRELPVSQQRQEFLDAYHSAQVMVLSTTTGTGTSTEIPQFVFLDEFASGKIVGCTQAREYTAVSTAKRIAAEMDVELGQEVACSEHRTRDGLTRLRCTTEDQMLRENIEDNVFSAYSCIIVDLVHERTPLTNVLLASLKKAVARRADFKLIVISAILESGDLINYFENTSILEVRGPAHPVEITTWPKPWSANLDHAVSKVKGLHGSEQPGNILVFVASDFEAAEFSDFFRMETDGLEALPLCPPRWVPLARLSPQSYWRKCFVTSKLAEAHRITEEIRWVFDTGLAERVYYNPRANLDMTTIMCVSRAYAQRRADLAGRGKIEYCFRMYSEETLETASLASVPKSELVGGILLLKGMGHHEVSASDFIDTPSRGIMFRSLQKLRDWGYIAKDATITNEGRNALKLPVHIVWYRAILEAHRLGCSDEMVSLAALLSTEQSIFYGSEKLAEYGCPLSDHARHLKALRAYVVAKDHGWIMDAWCIRHFHRHSALEEALRLRRQLEPVARMLLGGPLKTFRRFWEKGFDENIRQALARSLFHQSAMRCSSKAYVTVHGNWHASLHPRSALVGAEPKWVIFSRAIDNPVQRTDRDFVDEEATREQCIDIVTAVEPEWLVDLEYFQDDNLARKRSTGAFRQPRVKASLDRARARKEKRLLKGG